MLGLLLAFGQQKQTQQKEERELPKHIIIATKLRLFLPSLVTFFLALH
jgi:hypothetical protein